MVSRHCKRALRCRERSRGGAENDAIWREWSALASMAESAALVAQHEQMRSDFERMHPPYDGPMTHGSPEYSQPQPYRDLPPEPPAGLAPSRVRELLGDCRGPRRVVVSHLCKGGTGGASKEAGPSAQRGEAEAAGGLFA